MNEMDGILREEPITKETRKEKMGHLPLGFNQEMKQTDVSGAIDKWQFFFHSLTFLIGEKELERKKQFTTVIYCQAIPTDKGAISEGTGNEKESKGGAPSKEED